MKLFSPHTCRLYRLIKGISRASLVSLPKSLGHHYDQHPLLKLLDILLRNFSESNTQKVNDSPLQLKFYFQNLRKRKQARFLPVLQFRKFIYPTFQNFQNNLEKEKRTRVQLPPRKNRPQFLLLSRESDAKRSAAHRRISWPFREKPGLEWSLPGVVTQPREDDGV